MGGGGLGEQDQSSVALTRLFGQCPLVILVGRDVASRLDESVCSHVQVGSSV